MKLEDEKQPLRLILIGFVLVTLGMVLPFLMVMQVVKSTFFLNFFAFGASVSGIFLGIIGGAMYVRQTQKKKKS
jgi:membrane associated rhomboid family serine protease